MNNELNKEAFSSSDITALVHYYRGEVHRMNTWRQRLDVTTNWAIITSAGFLSFGFGNKEITHFVIVLATIIVTCFLFIEARRYKYYAFGDGGLLSLMKIFLQAYFHQIKNL